MQRPNTAVFRLVIAYPFHMRCVLGFDGGGTKTDCVLMDENARILARSRSGPSNPSRVGMDKAFAALVDAADQVLAAAGKSAADVVSICGGVGGAGLTRATPEFHRRFKLKFPNATATINTDLSMALAATGETPSVVVIAGTGSAAIGRNACGTLASEGGLGPILGDPGSAYDIGRKAVIAGLRQSQPGENSYLGNEILDAFKCNWIELQDQIRANPDSVLPKICPLVTKAANEADDSARTILRSAAHELSEVAARVVDRLELREEVFFLAKTGGVFGHSSYFDDTFDNLMLQIAPKAKVGQLPATIAEFCARAAVECLDSPVRRVGG
jgi:N-acetylglucosamine kinase-like BadF-type ATPase